MTWQGADRVMAASSVTQRRRQERQFSLPWVKLHADALTGLAVRICHRFTSEIRVRKISMKWGRRQKSDIQPLDGLVAYDDGWEEENDWGTAHRSKYYNVHLHPPGPHQRHHGLCHFERKEKKKGQEKTEVWMQKKRISIMCLTNRKTK